MNKFLLDALRCPFCSGTFTVTNGAEQSDNWEYAVLRCYCERYPVVAGIPIIRKGVLGARGETARTVCQCIESGKNQEALLAVAMAQPVSAEMAPAWLQQLPQVKGMGRIRSLCGRVAISRWTEHAQEFLIAGPQGKTAKDYLEFHFLHSGAMYKEKEYNYFMNRFGQPRHLVALSLMTVIEAPRKPVLDFGCGFGHLTHHLSRRVGPQPIIGADRDFIRLYIAKNFLAPDAFYVCCDGDTSLPFINEFFSAVYLSDTLYMVTNRVICSRELQRVTDSDGLIVVAGIHNRVAKLRKYSVNMPYHTYGELFAPLPHRILANADVLNRYVQKRGPDLTRSSEKQTLDHEPWFSLVATKREDLLVDRGPFADWPHAEGQLELNSLYKPVGDQGNGTVETLYHHTFPSSWYEQEDGDCRKYEPESVAISSQILKDLSARTRTADMEDLIAHCVIVGIPERFH